jgi:hypothetical protein
MTWLRSPNYSSNRVEIDQGRCDEIEGVKSVRRFLSLWVYWVAGTLVLIFVTVLLLRPTQGVKFPDGSVLSVLYSRYANWHPVVYGNVGYAISKILPHEGIFVLNRWCLGHRLRPLIGDFSNNPTEKSWQVELVLSGIDPGRDHPLLTPNIFFATNLVAIAVGTDGRRYTNSLTVYPDPTDLNVRRVFTAHLLTYPMDDKVTIEIWNGGTNAVCRCVVRNPVR